MAYKNTNETFKSPEISNKELLITDIAKEEFSIK